MKSTRAQDTAEPETEDSDDYHTSLLSSLRDENLKLKKILERTLDESLRVCVVAPIVNVHFNDQLLKYRSR